MDDIRLKYLDMLQSLIGRMAGNQFSVRAWSVGLGTAVIGFAASKDGNVKASLLAAFPALVFWVTDAYYLALERKFRGIFKAACEDANHKNFAFDPELKARDVRGALLRPAVWLTHLPMIVLALAIGGWAWLH
jgi:hypothetical protein